MNAYNRLREYTRCASQSLASFPARSADVNECDRVAANWPLSGPRGGSFRWDPIYKSLHGPNCEEFAGGPLLIVFGDRSMFDDMQSTHESRHISNIDPMVVTGGHCLTGQKVDIRI